MRPQKIDDASLIKRLLEVIRQKGYEGASLNDLANASGLQKASLYHRFPGGKKDIGYAVLEYAKSWNISNLVTVNNDKTVSPEERLLRILDNINSLYNCGEATCIIRALSIGSGLEMFQEQLEDNTKIWLEVFKDLGQDFGFSKEKASDLALQVLVKIQGSLIVSKTLNSNTPFEKALREIEAFYR